MLRNLFLFLLLFPLVCGRMCDSICGAFAPGDVHIGIMQPCHSTVDSMNQRLKPEGFNCTDFNLVSFVRMLAAIHSINLINDSGFLPGVQLGYLVCDDCGNPMKAVQITEYLLATNGSWTIQCDSIDHPPLKALIGARYSEVSITVARILGLHMVPQISTSSSAAVLKDKLRFPSFLRTVPSDVHQTNALAKLMPFFEWDWIGVVSGDDDYAKPALQSFLEKAAADKFCVAYQKILSHLRKDANDSQIMEIATTIRSYTEVQVVLLILKEEEVMQLFQAMISTSTSRIWIATDSWSLSKSIASMEGIERVGEIFGFSFITGPNPGFSNFLQNLNPRPGVVNKFIEEYKNLRFACTDEPSSLTFKSPQACNITDPQQANDDFLVQSVYLNVTYSERLAVFAIAQALRNVLNCNETDCPGDKDFEPWKLYEELSNVNFTLNNQQYYFNKSSFGNGYNLVNWVRVGDKTDFQVVGHYSTVNEDVEVIHNAINWSTPDNQVPVSKCSPPCQPGTFKKVSDISCCYNCTPCEEGTFSDKPDMLTCLSCTNGTWSLKGWNYCAPRTESFFGWNEPFAIAILTFVGLGVILLLFVFIIYLVSHDSPAIKVAGGFLCYVMMAGLALSFGGVVLFMGKPNKMICQARQTMYGLGFTLCVSCILVKALRTFLTFLFDLNQQHKLKKLYQPLWIIIIFTTIQGFICIFWLVFDSPTLETITFNQTMDILFQCTEGSGIGFGVMLSYIGLLALLCFLLAMKGRKVPQRFNQTGYIIFSMVIYLFVWVCFIPIYVTKNQQRSPVQASAILVSNLGIIFCHFMPACYMVLCKKKIENTLQAYRNKVRLFSLTSTYVANDNISNDSGAAELQASARALGLNESAVSGSLSTVYKDFIAKNFQFTNATPRKRFRTRSI